MDRITNASKKLTKNQQKIRKYRNFLGYIVKY